MPTVPTTPLQDPDFSLDPSIIAQKWAAEDRAQAARVAQAREKWRTENPLPTGPRGGPQFVPSYADGGEVDPLDGWTAEPVDHDPFAGGGRVGFADGGGVPYFIGDSIANGLQTAARGEGDTLVGRSPAAVLQAINRADSQQLAGRRIVLSTGLSNNPSDLRSVQAQFAALRAKGVDPSNITVVGLGSRSDIAEVAPSLQKIVNQNGANFTGNFQAGSDGVHPANYNQVLRSTSAAPSSVDQTTEVVPAPRVETPSTDEGFVPPRSGAPIQTGGPTPQPRFVVEHGMGGQTYTALNLAPGAGLAPEPTGPGWGPPEGDKWSGGRVGFADGGAPEDDPLAGSVTYAHPQLEPVDYDPFPPPPKVEPSDIARAKGFPEPRSPMHDRIEALSQDEGAVDPSIAAHAAAAAPESWAHYAGNPEHPMWRRIGAAGVEEARRVGQGLWSAGTLPGDIATGKTTMEDPEAQRRVMDLAGAVTLAPVGEVPEGALTAGMRRRAPRRPVGELPEVTSTYEPPGWEAKAAELKPPPPPPAELSTDAEKLSMIGHNKGPSIEQPLVNQALPSFEHPDFPEGRIATSVPTSAARGDAAHSDNSLQIGMDLARENPETYRKNADVIRNYDWLRLPENATDDQAHEALINHVKNNLVALHDAINPDYRPGSSQWYDGANQIVNGMASEYGRRPENTAGLVAALSPQRDWFMNVENARRVADVLHHQKDMPVSAAMEQWARNYANSRNPTGRVTPDIVNGMIDGMIGKPLSEMTPEQKAFYVRMYDAAHGPHPSRLPVDAEGNPHPEGYYILNPDGSSTGRVARTNSRAVKRLTWGSGGQLANAIRAFEAEDMPTISRAMGNRHKVRNFYNNNVSPNSASGATTIDTHAIAGGLLQPLGASAPEVEHGLGMKGSKFNGNGSSGLYPNYFEGYRRAAQEISKRPGGQTILPRQLQSITWEGIRGLFSPAQRSSPSFIEGIKNLWRQYASGRLSLRNVLQRIFRNPETGESNIKPPQWVTGDDRVEDEAGE